MRRSPVTGNAIASAPSTPAEPTPGRNSVPVADSEPMATEEWQRHFLEGQNAALELIANGAELDVTLSHLCRTLERLLPDTLCAILLLRGECLHLGAAPSLPKAYSAAIDGFPIGPEAGSCGTAAWRRWPVAVSDIATDPLWRGDPFGALHYGLRACWSYPILAKSGNVLGTFAVYHRSPRSPSEEDWQTAADVARVARIAIERDHKDHALHDAMAEIRRLSDNLPGMVYRRLTAPDGSTRYTYVSDRSLDLFGLTPDEIIADASRLHRCIEIGYRAEFHRQMQTAAAALCLWETEVPINAPDGTRRWIQAVARPKLLADGSVLCDGIAIDITRRKLAETAATSAQRRLQEAIESISEGFTLYDRRDRLVAFNRRYLEIYPELEGIITPGVRFDTILHEALERGIFSVSETMYEDWIAERKARRRRPTQPMEFATRDGRYIRIEERRTEDSGIVAIHRDITEAKRQEEAAQRQSTLLQQTLESLNIGVSVFDHDLRLVALNQRFCELMGFPSEFSQVGRPYVDFLRYAAQRAEGDESGREAKIAERLAEARRSVPHLSDRIRPDGTIIEVRGNPMPYGGFVTSYTDITERRRSRQALKESEERLRERVAELEDTRERLEHQGLELVELAESLSQARDEAEAASRTKSEFLANMSHELRTPLNAVIGFSEIMMGEMFGPLGDPRYGDYARDMHDSGTHLLALINDILDLSKIEASRLELHESPIDITRVTDTCTRLVEERAATAGVAIIIQIAKGLPPILADEIKLKQILLNLLSNAVKFTPAGGSIIVTVGHAENGDFHLEVRDTGIGMKRADIPIALQPFGQIDNQLSRKYSGTGLGLPLSKSLVELHGGTLAIDSEPDRGTTIFVTLPASRFVRTRGQAPTAA